MPCGGFDEDLCWKVSVEGEAAVQFDCDQDLVAWVTGRLMTLPVYQKLTIERRLVADDLPSRPRSDKDGNG